MNVLIVFWISVLAVQSSPQELFARLSTLDGELFDAYNKCELDKFEKFFSESVEFFHDKGGVTNSSKSVAEAVRANVCGKVRRELIPGSMEVYPIPGYGAIQTGSHRFYNRQSGVEETGPPAKFLHIWQNTDGVWKLTRVVSYAHP